MSWPFRLERTFPRLKLLVSAGKSGSVGVCIFKQECLRLKGMKFIHASMLYNRYIHVYSWPS